MHTEVKEVIRRWVPQPVIRACQAMVLRPPKDTPQRRERLRQEALARTTLQPSRDLLEKMPSLVAHGYPSGNPDLHYQDTEVKTGIACTAAEACLLHHAARLAQPRAALEIGSYIGWSTVHIASTIATTLSCVDPFLKGGGIHENKDAAAEARFLANVRRAGVQDRVRLHAHKSPDVLRAIAPPGRWDWAFVDGWHMDGQPLRDVLGLEHHLSEDAVLFLHDCWGADVRDALTRLLATGWHAHVFDTSNYLTILWRVRPRWLETFLELARRDAYVNPVAAARKPYFGLGEASLRAVRTVYQVPETDVHS